MTTNTNQIRSVAQSCPTLCDPMNLSTPGLPVQHQLPEFTETHFHRVSDAIQPSHPLSSPSPPAPQSFPASVSFLMSHFLTSGGQSTGVSALASFLAKKSQGWSPSEWTGWISLPLNCFPKWFCLFNQQWMSLPLSVYWLSRVSKTFKISLKK